MLKRFDSFLRPSWLAVAVPQGWDNGAKVHVCRLINAFKLVIWQRFLLSEYVRRYITSTTR